MADGIPETGGEPLRNGGHPAGGSGSTEWLTASEIACKMSVTRGAVYKWAAEGAPHREDHGTKFFDLHKIRKWRAENHPSDRGGDYRSEAAREDRAESGSLTPEELQEFLSDPSGRVLSLLDAKAAKEQFQAAQAAAKAAAYRGELLDASEVQDSWASALGVFGRALDALPARAAPKIVAAAADAIRGDGGESGLTPDRARSLTAAVVALLVGEVQVVRRSIIEDPVVAGGRQHGEEDNDSE